MEKLPAENRLDQEMIEEIFAEFFGIFFFNLGLLSLSILNIALDFPDNAMDYINNWTEHFDIFNNFSWVVLEQFPDWLKVKNSMRIVEQKCSFDTAANSSAVFEQFGYAKTYCSAEKLAEWKSKKMPADGRWVEIFQHMEARNVPFNEFATIIEFIFSFPGSSAPVERTFAKAKKIWKQESSQLQISTLNSMLQVKCNMEWTCIDFFKFLKTRPDLLRKISSQDKYGFKQPMLVRCQSADVSPMSVQYADSDSD